MNTPRRHMRWFVILGFSWAALSTRAQLTILQQPSGASNVALGQEKDFSVAATSSATANLQYQWRRNGVNIPGANNSMYPLPNVQGTNSGAYYAVVSDGVTALNSAPAILTANILVEVVDDLSLGLNGVGSVTGGVVRSSNAGAVKTAGQPDILPGNPGGHPISFRWTPLSSGIVTFSTAGSDFETMMGAYRGSSRTDLTPVPSVVNDADSAGYHNSLITFNAQALTEYHILVDGYSGDSGDIVLTWSENITSDKLAVFAAMPPPLTAAGNNAPASFAAPFDSGTLQWLFNGAPTAISSSTISINRASDSTVGIYVAQVTSARGNVTATRAADLQIAVLQDGSTPTNSFAYRKFFDAAKSPYAGPAAQTARKLSGGGDSRGYSVSQVFSTVGSQSEPGEPTVCGQIGGAPEWYVYVTPTNGTLEIDTDGSSFNTILGVFIGPGDSFATLTNIGCGYTTNRAQDGQPQIFLPNIPAKQTNFIVVDGENGTSGTVHLHINCGTPVTLSSPLTNQTVLAGGNATFSVGATGSTPISYVWQCCGTNIAGATNSTLTITNVQSAQQGVYMVVMSNLVSTANSSAMLLLDTLPVIIAPPASRTVSSNASVTLDVVATGLPPPSYQWYFNGATAGLNTNSLTIPQFQAAQQGTYLVVASNLVGAVPSAAAVLLLDAPLRAGTFLLTNGLFQLQLVGSAGSNYTVLFSSNLTSWTPLLTNTTANGYLNFSDSNTTSRPGRFYRAVGN